jgi:hypothetical protein
MKTAILTKFALVLAALCLVCPGMSRAGLPVLFYDNFDDGNFDGWSPTYPTTGDPATPPDVVPSPQGYSLRGIGSGYYPTDDPGLTVLLSHPVSLSNVGELSIEFRAKSGPQWPNQAQVWLVSGKDCYLVIDYGESNKRADWLISVNGQTQHYFSYSIGNLAYEWHDFAWTRNADGWWSLSIDGQIQAANFYQDNQLTSFDKVGMHIVRNQSEIEWVRISGQIGTPTEPPIADAGDDIIAGANETVTLDGSASYDPDGIIIKYTWKRLPDDVILYSGESPTYNTKALGRVEEVIELTVTDNSSATASDTLKIVSRTTADLQNQLAAMQSQIDQVQRQNQELRALLDKISSFPPIAQWLRRAAKFGDLDGDGRVNMTDFALLTKGWLR